MSSISLFILLKKAQAVVKKNQDKKTSRKNVTSTVLIFLLFCLFNGRHGCKNHSQLRRTALKWKKKKHVHTRKELEAQ